MKQTANIIFHFICVWCLVISIFKCEISASGLRICINNTHTSFKCYSYALCSGAVEPTFFFFNLDVTITLNILSDEALLLSGYRT